MPYDWTTSDPAATAIELRLWPHQSLPPKGFAAFILATFTMATIPLFVLLGTSLLWALLPFLLIALSGMYYALRRNDRDRQILEVLTLTSQDLHLVRKNPRGPEQEWHCNTYWARVALHEGGGPVPYYVTLSGSGREVEIGAFLSEDERKTLYSDLSSRLRHLSQTHGR
ncbi:hypothetical protein P775_18430 [Puniceibacterium antarcticum]|uniref:Integral membrane protein n=1 Tax=Puniceibacterium antarcticum TaxID=1206336 RepID=A0A2G8RAJ1_9RHOB|nr:DUF2244 domain-containing protein [Puniceibacterium antarcticum]PIL18552.1 hypothetical protein P775_18430 [Puniceibacterium antarcticum]